MQFYITQIIKSQRKKLDLQLPIQIKLHTSKNTELISAVLNFNYINNH